MGAITSQNGTAPKQKLAIQPTKQVRLPVRTALLQNRLSLRAGINHVRLPVRTALLQNCSCRAYQVIWCDYQSERHCSKTTYPMLSRSARCDYQSERHCSKTIILIPPIRLTCDYQSERHCSKTTYLLLCKTPKCDYQSERHCSKTPRYAAR